MCVCVCVCVCAQSLRWVWFFVTSWTVAHQAPLSMEFSHQEYWNTEEGCHFLLQGIILIQGSNLHLLHLLHWQVDSLPLSHLGSLYKDYKGVIISMHRTVLFLPEMLSNPDIRRKLKFIGQNTAKKKDVDIVS